jgi:hypothetical protein
MSLLLLPYNWLPTIAMGLTIPRWPAMTIIVCYWLLYLPNRILLSRDFEWLSVWCWTGRTDAYQKVLASFHEHDKLL